MVDLLGFLEEGVGFAEEEFGAAGLFEHLEGSAEGLALALYLGEVAGVGGEHEHAAFGEFGVDFLGELEA